MLQLYTKPKCPPCSATKRTLDKLEIEYQQFDVTADPSAAEAVRALGYISTPVVVVDEKNHWTGFRPDRLNGLA